MRRVLELPPAAVISARTDVLRGQGGTPATAVSDRVEALFAAGDLTFGDSFFT